MNETAVTPASTSVAIEIPASNRHAALVRTAAVGIIADLDPDLDVVENLRLAVNELVSLVIEATGGGSVRVEFRIESTTLRVTAQPSEPGHAVVVDELARRILETTTTHHQFHEDGSGELSIDIGGSDNQGMLAGG